MDIFVLGLFFAVVFGTIIIFIIMGRIKTAKLIAENSIISIIPVDVNNHSVLVNISCFGISVGHKYYKFNREGIPLTKIDINKTSITLYFGNIEKQNKIIVLHDLRDKSEANKIAEKFRYETGIIPSVSWI